MPLPEPSILPHVKLPAWYRPGVIVPMPDYTRPEWSLRKGNPNIGRVYPGGKSTNRTEC